MTNPGLEVEGGGKTVGCFDSVLVKCPKCGEEHEFQSKSGDCILAHYTLEDAPDDVMYGANLHEPLPCSCGAWLTLEFEPVVTQVVKPSVRRVVLVDPPPMEALSIICEAHEANFKAQCELYRQFGEEVERLWRRHLQRLQRRLIMPGEGKK